MPIIPAGGSGSGSATDLTKFYNYSYSSSIEAVSWTERTIVPPTSKPSPRTVWIYNSGLTPVNLQFRNDEGRFIDYPLPPGMAFIEDNAGGSGNEFFLRGTGSVSVLIRSRDPINKEEIDDMPLAPLEIELLLPTGNNFPIPHYDPSSVSEEGLDSVMTLFNSNNGSLTGYKLFDFASFQLGQSYNFTINVAAGVNLPAGDSIQVWMPNIIGNSMRTLFEIASDLLNPEIDGLPSGFVSSIKQGGWLGNYSAGALVTLKPNLSRKIGAIYAHNPANGYSECCIISYDKDARAFTILGF
ncbi:hypothetical protein [Oscillatoria acuminata]|uniref:Uncharacterized protein n=1 Tax=Oscillatoria acuminata PCC 6304 TaxID=56110 RepID=K9TCL4_9CYAN|nr:hypothetical protein [Oscillatoria acuminata]AFY80173.1 hypothetical protein Oscil6304_0424 [Oscillatoria acuminata PCC 6304]